MEFLTRPITSERLEEKGQSLYKLGKKFIFMGVCGFAVLLLSMLIALAMYGSEGLINLIILNLRGFELMYVIVPVAYIGVCLGLIGVPMYFNGLNVFALGRIARNTEKE